MPQFLFHHNTQTRTIQRSSSSTVFYVSLFIEEETLFMSLHGMGSEETERHKHCGIFFMSSLQKRPFSWERPKGRLFLGLLKMRPATTEFPLFFFQFSFFFLFFFCPLYILPLLRPIVRYFRALRALHQRNAVDVLSRIHSDTSVSRIFLTWASRNTICFYLKILRFFRIRIFVSQQMLSGNSARCLFRMSVYFLRFAFGVS